MFISNQIISNHFEMLIYLYPLDYHLFFMHVNYQNIRLFLIGVYFTGRNFRVFAFFGHFRETKSPRKEMTSRFAKVYPTQNVFYEKEGS